MDAVLILSDGTQFPGRSFGYREAIAAATSSASSSNETAIVPSGELVFQTGMVGYVESLTDPSFFGQILVLAYPLIGNYGVPDVTAKDSFDLFTNVESIDGHIQARALVVSSLCEAHSHWEARESLHDWMHREQIIGIEGVDTRSLIEKLRESGPLLARIVSRSVASQPLESITMTDPNLENLVARVSISEKRVYTSSALSSPAAQQRAFYYRRHQLERHHAANPPTAKKILLLDLGVKISVLRSLLYRGASVTAVPWNTNLVELLRVEKFDGLLVSSGPGDPALLRDVIANLQAVLNEFAELPIFGICLGHQLLACTTAARTYKLKYGNRGHNQPAVLHDETTPGGVGEKLISSGQGQRCFMTAQNHGYAVDAVTLSNEWQVLFTNANDHTNEGIIHTSLPRFGVQFHPEHKAGPDDCEWLFDYFVALCNGQRDIIGAAGPAIFYDRIFALRPLGKLKNGDDPVNSEDEAVSNTNWNPSTPHKVLVLGSGGLTIGQAGEFDYSGSQCLKALRERGVHSILINPNIATVQTSRGMADKVYFLPISPAYVEEVIRIERPDGIMLQFGGQTALNCGVELDRLGVFTKYKTRVLGTPISSIVATEDRDIFNQRLAEIGDSTAPSRAVSSVAEALEAVQQIGGYPVIARAAFALGGLGSGFASSDAELTALCEKAFATSPQVLVERSLKGWKEVEYEVVRDRVGNSVTVCNMENFDPLGVHTGESIVVAPSQTLSNAEYFMLRRVALDVVAHLRVVGECNIQFALNPFSREYFVIEVNARLSRSSALASKATGFPLAYIAANLALGSLLPDLRNQVTQKTTACFEPSLDYLVIKVPKWEMAKFPRVDPRIGTAMKSVGEVMAIGRSFPETIQKALRMIDSRMDGFTPNVVGWTDDLLENPTDQRVFALATALADGCSLERLHKLTRIDMWFLNHLSTIIQFPKTALKNERSLDAETLRLAKQLGFSDRGIARCVESTELAVREQRLHFGIHPYSKHIDTVAAEFPAQNNYLYLTYHASSNDSESSSSADKKHDLQTSSEEDSAPDSDQCNKVVVLGSGAYSIGTSVEFDWCAVHALRELRELGRSTVMINCNPETVSTDYDECDVLYFESLGLETVLDVCSLVNPDGVVVSMGGQLPNNIVMPLYRQGVPLLGTDPEMVDSAENRFKFSRLCDSVGLAQPKWKEAISFESCLEFCQEVGFPCMVRPSYVISGAAMAVIHSHDQLEDVLSGAATISKEHPIVISKFIEGAKEIEYDGVAQNGKIVLHAISEHVENAGVHSGDATLISPPTDLDPLTIEKVEQASASIAAALAISGPFNIQYIAKDNAILIIECNVRASRSFPFTSKVHQVNFARAATRVLFPDLPHTDEMISSPLYGPATSVAHTSRNVPFVGVKVPQFSFSRLPGADPILGVAMQSTGEVACFGKNRYSAYIKAMLAAGHPRPAPGSGVLLSIGSFSQKGEFLRSVQDLARLGYVIYATPGTADYYREHGVTQIKVVPLIEEAAHVSSETVRGVLSAGAVSLVINISATHLISFRSSRYHSPGYKMRRGAIDRAIPLITDIKSAKMFVRGLTEVARHPVPLDTWDVSCSRDLIRMPGFIDVHVHIREPGAEHKETWATGTAAALAGGFTMVCAMPNTSPPIDTVERLDLVRGLAAAGARCDYALYVQGTATNFEDEQLLACADDIAGVKLYLNQTFNNAGGSCGSDVSASTADVGMWRKHFAAWPASTPIVVHAEGRTLAAVLLLTVLHKRPVHIAHVALRDEIELVAECKRQGLPVTCEVSPHHLFLTRSRAQQTLPGPGGRVEVRPRLGTDDDVAALWEHMDLIDIFATDHAPHLPREKDVDPPTGAPPGFPGLETALPLLLTAVHQGRLSLAQLEERLVHNPRRIFRLPEQPDTYVEIDLNHEWTIPERTKECKAGWTPFAGWKVVGQISRVTLRGEIAYDRCAGVLSEQGNGRNIFDKSLSTVHPSQHVRKPASASSSSSGITASSSSSTLSTSPSSSSSLSSSLSHRPKTSSFLSRSRDETELLEVHHKEHGAVVRHEKSSESLSSRFALASNSEDSLSVSPQSSRRRGSNALTTASPTSSSSRSSSHQQQKEHRGLHHPSAKPESIHFFSITQFSRTQVRSIFSVAHELRLMTRRMGSLTICKGLILATAFFEPSTRTACSFQAAMHRLGGSVIHVDSASSSRAKGESLSDTLRTLASYVDIIALRTSETGSEVASAARGIHIPMINAGDGIGEHPTQALLDVFTIREELGTCNGITVLIVGDLKHGRTVHSLVKCLSLFDVRKIVYVSDPSLKMPADLLQQVPSRIQQFETEDLEQALSLHQPDVLYVTRVQRERFASAQDYDAVASRYRITPHTLRNTRESMIIMHPLPRVDEIDPLVDSDPRAAYFRQMENGVAIRMALLATLLKRVDLAEQ